MLDDLGHPVLDGLFDIMFTPVHQVGIEPQHTKGKHHAHIWRQAYHTLEHGHHDQKQHTKHKDGLALAASNIRRSERCVLVGLLLGYHTFKKSGSNSSRYHHRHDTGQNQRRHQLGRTDIALHPEHDGGHVSYRRPRTSAIGSNDDNGCEQPSLLIVGEHTPDEHDHDYGRSHIVQH